jgi:hypothetical protein
MGAPASACVRADFDSASGVGRMQRNHFWLTRPYQLGAKRAEKSNLLRTLCTHARFLARVGRILITFPTQMNNLPEPPSAGRSCRMAHTRSQ